MAIVNFDPTTILNYYSSKLASQAASANLAASGSANANSSSSSSGSSSTKPLDTTGTTPPWDASQPQPTEQQADVTALADTPFITLSQADLDPLQSQGTAAADNARLYALYQAANRLSTLANMASDTTAPPGTLAGLNTRFQEGISEIQKFLGAQTFDNVTVIPGVKTSSATSSVAIPLPTTSYTGGVAVTGDVFQAVPGLSASDTINVTVTKNGVATNMAVDLSQIQGTLSLDNVAGAINTQLAANGFTTRVHRVEIGDAAPGADKSFGLEITGTVNEKLTMSASDAQPAVYMAGTSGTGDDQSGRLVKLTDLGTGALASVFSRDITPDPVTQTTANASSDSSTDTTDSGTTTATVSGGAATARGSVVDAQGNVYVVGDTTGNFGNQVNQAGAAGGSDVFLRKYDSAGNVLWTRLLGSADDASGYSLALDPTGGVVVAGAVSDDLTPTAVGGGQDSFVAKYSADGEQTFLRQVAPVANDAARSLAVGSDGSIYLGGQVSGTIASGQTDAGGQDAYVTKLDATGKLVYNREFGTAGTDTASQVAVTDDGGLVVASQQNGHAIVTKYAAADGTSPALWQVDLGDLKGGSIGGLAVDGNAVYVSGGTGNANLTAGGQATIANAFSGGSDAFVAKIDDAGSSARADYVSYVGTSASDRGGGVTVGADGGIYLTGSTQGTFAGEHAPASGATNAFVARLDPNGAVDWAHQFGGFGGQSTGASISVAATGASALDALGLPQAVTGQESLDLESQSTVRAGDYFTMNVTDAQGNTRSKRITIDPGETMQSLAGKINQVLVLNGTAKATFSEQGQSLNISVNSGIEVTLDPGQGSFDALAGLGIDERVLVGSDPTQTTQTNAPNTNDSLLNVLQGFNPDGTPASSSANSSSTQKPVVGLDLQPDLDLSTTADAANAATAMQGLLATIRSTYRQINPDPALQALLNSSSASASKGKQGGTVPAEVSKQLAAYQTALERLGATSSSGTQSPGIFTLAAQLGSMT